jgi:uncharacterized protein (TIRG00374 family)
LKSYISTLKYLLLLAIGISLLVLAFKGQDLDALLRDLKRAEYGWVMASVAACIIAHILRAIRWRMMIRSLGHGTPSLLNTCYAVIIGYMANLAFPRMGEVSRCGVINRTDKIPIVKLIGTVIVERIVDLIMLCLVIGGAVFLQFKLLSNFLYNNIVLKFTGESGGKGSSGILPILLFLIILLVVAIFILIRKKEWGISQKIHALLKDIRSGILSIKKLDNKSGFIITSVLIWVCYGFSTYLCFFALDSTSGLGAMAALSALVFSSLGMIAPVQGGIGAFHWMVSEGLTIYAIPKSEGLAYALLIHSSQTLLILFAGAISLIMLMVKSPKSTKNEQA